MLMQKTRKRKAPFPMKKPRFYVFSNATMDYREVRLFRPKVILSGLALGLVTIGLVLLVNHYSNDVLGLGYNKLSLLRLENHLLKEQLGKLTDRMESLQGSLNELSDQGNELRLMVDLVPIDAETREAGAGGAETSSNFLFLTGEANEILSRSQSLVDKLKREIDIQNTSSEEIFRRYERNKDFFSHLPAIKPVRGSYAITGFGMRVHPVLGIYRMHQGVDFIADVGTTIYATADGIVRYAGRTQGGYGAVIEIAHGYGYSSLYAHLSKVYVRRGQSVKRGEQIAKSGRSGLVSGPHLHYEVRYKGRKVNPVDFFFDDVSPSDYRSMLAERSGD